VDQRLRNTSIVRLEPERISFLAGLGALPTTRELDMNRLSPTRKGHTPLPISRRSAWLIAVVIIVLWAGCAGGPRPATPTASMELELYRWLWAVRDYTEDTWWPKYERYTYLLQQTERTLNVVRQQRDRNMSFYLAAESVFGLYARAQKEWQLSRRDDPRRYHEGARNQLWKQAAEELDRAETLIRW
jgi:hypothetical protein